MKSPRHWVDKFELTEHETEELALVEEIQTDARAEPLAVLRELLECMRLGILIHFTTAERPDGSMSKDSAADNARFDAAYSKAEALLAGEPEPERTEPTVEQVARAVLDEAADRVSYCSESPTLADRLRKIPVAPILTKLRAELGGTEADRNEIGFAGYYVDRPELNT